jgi:DNA-binding transcriptional regulator/RsmH inhibitor MraZ
MPVWICRRRAALQNPKHAPARVKFLDRVNFYGQVTEFDVQGRVLIPGRLRDAAGMAGDVDVLGQVEFSKCGTTTGSDQAQSSLHG